MLLLAKIFIYLFIGDYHLIDFRAMNDRVTSSARTPRSSNFRSEIIERDGPVCVFTEAGGVDCEAAHLLPLSKGDEVYIFVTQRHRLAKCSPSTFNSFFKTVSIFITLMKNPLI